MKKRHEVLAMLAAAAGLAFTPAAQASVITHIDPGTQSSSEQLLPALQETLGTIEDQATADAVLSKMIHLASAKGFEKSNNANAAGSPGKSPQGNGKAKGFGNSDNPNAAGSSTKPAQGKGNNPS